jgi:predicted RNase H-like HicB family nuclease
VREERHDYDGVHGDHREGGDLYAALRPELDVASQGATVEEATSNLREAVELFLECADSEELKRRLRTEVFVTRIEAKHG